jgi:microcompartment protein CcmK/EutM
MFLADVIGTVVSPVTIPILQGETQLLVRPLSPTGERSGKTRIALDRAQAGVGDRVLVLDEGNGARQIFGDPMGAVKTVIIAVVDYVDTTAGRVYDHREPEARQR